MKVPSIDISRGIINLVPPFRKQPMKLAEYLSKNSKIGESSIPNTYKQVQITGTLSTLLTHNKAQFTHLT